MKDLLKQNLLFFQTIQRWGIWRLRQHFYTLSGVSSVSTLLPAGGRPLFANQVLLQHNMLIHLHTVCGCLCVSSQLNSGERDCLAYKVKHIYYPALYRKHFPTSDI